MNNKKLIIPILTLLCLFSITLISGLTFISPSTAGSTVNGTYTFNVTTTMIHIKNCTWSTTDNANFGFKANTTANQSSFWNTTTTTGLTDREDTVLNVTCRNDSTAESGTLTINVDNTDPVCSFSIDKTIISVNDVTGIETTDASSDTTDLTYSWILFRGDNTQSQTSSSQNPSFSGTDFDQIDNYNLALTITDEASKSTSCTNQTITVRGSDDDNLPPIIDTTIKTKNKDMAIPIIVGFVVFFVIILAVLLIWILNQNK